MRLIKYFFFIVLYFVSVNTFADYEYVLTNLNKTVSTTFVGSETTHNQNLTDACKQLSAKVGHTSGTISWTNNGSVGQCTRNGSAFGDWTRTIYTPKCPSPNVIIHVSFDDLEHVPLRVCTEIAPGKYCASVGNETTISGGGNYLGGYQRPSILHRSLSETPQNSCTPLFSDSPCDSKDPYGGCYVPPDDGCTRQKDGSIYCPPEAPPPQPDETCNGATYCKAPPQGCGEGYVRGSFNGQELCVKSGPSNPPKPDQPDDPENCANGGTYCPAPPNDDLCPDGYYPTTHNGSKICVKNNPNPNEPNPNDPNNNNGGDNGGDGETGGTGVDLSEIINAIKALRDALLQALGSISQKLSTLITGQKESNEHLDDIKKESIKTNQKLDEVNENITTTNSKLDTANDHLKNISDHSAAASEALGESNKKLDGIKDAVEGQYKCANESYDPNDKRSNKYRDCTEQDITGGSVEDTKVDIKEQTVNLENDLRRDLFGGNSTCPPPMVIEFTFINKVRLEYPYDLMCDGAALVRPWIILLGLLVSYFVVTGQRSGGQD